MSRKLYIGNLPFKTTQNQLQELFSTAGDITHIYLSRNRYTSKSSGFGFIEMATEADAQKAVELFHGYVIDDRPMTVQGVAAPHAPTGNGSSTLVLYRKLPRPVEVKPAAEHQEAAPENSLQPSLKESPQENP